MEWLGVLLLYLISGFMKKRQQNKNREMIESDPSWDNEEAFEKEDSSNNIEQLLNDLFEQNPKITQSSSAVGEFAARHADVPAPPRHHRMQIAIYPPALSLVLVSSWTYAPVG